VPILLTYDSACISTNQNVDEVFKTALKDELTTHFESIANKCVSVPENFSLLFILMPLSSVAWIKSELEKAEEAMR